MYNEPKSNNIMKDYKIEIEKVPIKMKGYRLDPGSMVMGGGKNIQLEDNRGLDRESQTSMLDQKMLNKWCILYNKREQDIFNQFVNVIKQCIS